MHSEELNNDAKTSFFIVATVPIFRTGNFLMFAAANG